MGKLLLVIVAVVVASGCMGSSATTSAPHPVTQSRPPANITARAAVVKAVGVLRHERFGRFRNMTAIRCLPRHSTTPNHLLCSAVNQGRRSPFVVYLYPDGTHTVFIGNKVLPLPDGMRIIGTVAIGKTVVESSLVGTPSAAP